MDEILTVEEYLRGKIGYEIPDKTLKSIFKDRNVDYGSSIDDVQLSQRELCLADLYMWCVNLPTTKNKTEDADGQWKHTDGGWIISSADKAQYRVLASAIYGRWGESVPTRKIRIKDFV